MDAARKGNGGGGGDDASKKQQRKSPRPRASATAIARTTNGNDGASTGSNKCANATTTKPKSNGINVAKPSDSSKKRKTPKAKKNTTTKKKKKNSQQSSNNTGNSNGSSKPKPKKQVSLVVFKTKDYLDQDPGQKDCLDVLQWNVHGNVIKKSDLDEKKLRSDQLRSEGRTLAKNQQFEEGQALIDQSTRLLEEIKGRRQNLQVCSSVETLAKRCFDAHMSSENYGNAGEWHTILLASRNIQGKDENGKLPVDVDSVAAAAAKVTKSKACTESKSGKREEAKAASSNVLSIDASSDEDDVAIIETKDGTKTNVDEVFEPAALHNQGQKKASRRSCIGKVLPQSRQGDFKEKSKKWKVTPQRFKRIIEAAWGPRKVRLDGKEVIMRGQNKMNQALRLDGDDLWCDACMKAINPEEVPQHITRKSHINKLKEYQMQQKRKQPTIRRLNDVMKKKQSKGQSLHGKIKYHRYTTFMKLCASNVPVASYFSGLSSFCDQGYGLSSGAAEDLADVYAPVYRDTICKGTKVLLKTKCFPEFATITDECASFAKCAGMKIVKITKDYRIIMPLVDFALHDKGLNGENTANRWLKSIRSGANEDPRSWGFAHYDGAATNDAGLKRIKDRTQYKPDGRICTGHTLCRCGEKVKTPHLEKFRNKFNICMRYTGKLTDQYKVVCGESPIKSGGIRFWVKFEQFAQFIDVGMETIMNIVQWCIDNDASKVSCESFKDIFGENRSACCVSLAMAILEAAAITDRLKLIVQCTYMSETNDPIILGASQMFTDLDRSAEKMEFDMPNITRLTPVINKLLLKGQQFYVDAIDSAEKEVTTARATHTSLSSELGQLQSSTTRQSRVGRQVRRRNFADTDDEDRQQTVQENISSLQIKVKEAAGDLSAREATLQSKKEAFEKWKGGSHRPGMNIPAYAAKVTDPAWAHYRNQFMTPGGKCYNTRQCCEAARVFDPFVLDIMSIDALKLLVDKLKFFNLEQFSDEFLQGLKNEFVIAKEHALEGFDWDSIVGSKQYKCRSNGRKLRKERAKVRGDIEEGDGEQSDALGNRSEIIQHSSWKCDPGERGRRIWRWWRVRIYEVGEANCAFKFFPTAIRLVALHQLGSCELERSFSVWVAIQHACGRQMKRDVIESRMFTRCNLDLLDEILECAGEAELASIKLRDDDVGNVEEEMEGDNEADEGDAADGEEANLMANEGEETNEGEVAAV